MTEIRLIGPGDRAMIQPLLAEIHHHYHGEPMPEPSMERTLHDLFEERSCAMLVAIDEGRAIGLATYAVFQPSTDGGGTMFVKDIFVSETARRQRLGRLVQRQAHPIMAGGEAFRFVVAHRVGAGLVGGQLNRLAAPRLALADRPVEDHLA